MKPPHHGLAGVEREKGPEGAGGGQLVILDGTK